MNNENNQGNVTNYVAPQQPVQPVQPVTEPKKKKTPVVLVLNVISTIAAAVVSFIIFKKIIIDGIIMIAGMISDPDVAGWLVFILPAFVIGVVIAIAIIGFIWILDLAFVLGTTAISEKLKKKNK